MKATPEFIKANEWSQQNSDYSPRDYAIWDSLKAKVYRGMQDELTEQALMNRIIMSWKEISIKEMRKSISMWKQRLRLVVEEDGGHNEHRLK